MKESDCPLENFDRDPFQSIDHIGHHMKFLPFYLNTVGENRVVFSPIQTIIIRNFVSMYLSLQRGAEKLIMTPHYIRVNRY